MTRDSSEHWVFAAGYVVRDLWSHSAAAAVGGGGALNLSATVESGGGQRLFRLAPLSGQI